MGRDAQYGFWTADHLGNAAPSLGAHIGFKGIGRTAMSEKDDRCSCVTVHLECPFLFASPTLPPVALPLQKIGATDLIARRLVNLLLFADLLPARLIARYEPTV